MVIFFFGCGPMKKEEQKVVEEKIVEIKQKVQRPVEDFVMVNLHEKVDPKRIISSFPKYGLQISCILNKEMNIVVYSFDRKATDQQSLIEFLDKEVGVEFASNEQNCGHLLNR